MPVHENRQLRARGKPKLHVDVLEALADRLASYSQHLFRNRLLPLLRTCAPRWVDTEEILNEAFATVWLHADSLRQPNSLLAYGRRVALRLLSRVVKQARRLPSRHAVDRPYSEQGESNLDSEKFIAAIVGGLNVGELELYRLVFIPPGGELPPQPAP